jgi:hypothetical protein
MPYDRTRDPENMRGPLGYDEALGLIMSEWHDNDTDFVAAAMAKYLAGRPDKFADAELVRVIRQRAESIIERAEEAAKVDPRDGWQE